MDTFSIACNKSVQRPANVVMQGRRNVSKKGSVRGARTPAAVREKKEVNFLKAFSYFLTLHCTKVNKWTDILYSGLYTLTFVLIHITQLHLQNTSMSAPASNSIHTNNTYRKIGKVD